MVLLVASKYLSAQAMPDSLTIRYGFIKDFPLDSLTLQAIDTSLFEYHIYDELYRHENFYNTTSNSGHAHRSLIFNPNLSAGYFYNYDGFEMFLLTPENLKYFSSLKPYINLNYVQGTGNDKAEGYVNAEYNQPLGKTIDFGLSFNFLNNTGFYTRQGAKNANFTSNFRFHTRDFRYGLIFSYYHTRLDIMENGGLINDAEFTDTVIIRKNIDINLTDASHFIKRGGWYLSHYFKLTKADSLTKDNHLNIRHTINFVRDRNIYEDLRPTEGFYDYFYTDSPSNIFDSTVFKSIKNNLAFTNFSNSNQAKFQFEVGADIDYHIIQYHIFANKVNVSTDDIFITSEQGSVDEYNIYNLIPYGKFLIHFKNFSLIPEAHFSFGNYNNGDYNVSGLINYSYKKFDFEAKYTSSAVDVPWMYSQISTTTAEWTNSFKKIFSNQAEITATYDVWQVGVKYLLMNNYAFLDQDITPQQDAGAISYLSAFVSSRYDIKRFEISGRLVYQYVSNKDVVRVPDLSAKLSFVYKQPLFKRALLSHIGLEAVYNTPFYAEAYMPSLRSFYLQDEVKTGNYPYINAFLRFQIKRARVFVEFINVTSGLTRYNYIGVPHYPLNDRQFKFGVSWYFHD